MEQELREKYPNLQHMADLPKLGAFIVFEKTQDMVNCYRAYTEKLFFKSTIKSMKLPELNLELGNDGLENLGLP